jgi:ACS family hexuronate transporter-like MFS transporter
MESTAPQQANVLPVDDRSPAPGTGEKPTNYRWVICSLLFYATTINYMDRSVLNVLSSTLQKSIGWSNIQFGNINMAFAIAYTIGFFVMGWLIDRLGTRLVYAIALAFWTLAGASTAFARSAFQFGICRFMLGIGESGNFPAAIKTVAEWFPQRQRATATGVFNAGSNVGAILAPWLVPLVVIQFGGWPAAFFITPILAAIWIVLWLTIYKHPSVHPRINRAELELIQSDNVPVTGKKVKWREILPHRQTWAIMVGKFLTDPVWWFYLTWSGKFLSDRYGVDLKHIGPPLIIIYVMADFGSIGGGWLSSTLMKHGWTANAARKTAMFTCALAVLPVCLAPLSTKWVAVFLIGIATSAHQGFSANIFTLTSDMFPKRAVGSVTGLAGFCGGVGGILIQFAAGHITQNHSYLSLFIIAGTVYLLAVTLIHVLAPRLKVVDLDGSDGPRGFPVVPV